MPPALDSGDRKLLLIAGSILLLLIIATLGLAPPPEEKEGQGISTTYSATNNGAQAAYLLLRELGYQSERWEMPPAELPSDSMGKILILAGPSNFPDKKERDALLTFARSGGWIIYAGNYPYLFLESGAVQAPSEIDITGPPSETFHAIAPSPLTLSAETISIRASNRWMTTDGSQIPLYGEPREPVVVTWQLEKGRVIWWASPTPLTNSGITREGNLPFFLGCIQAVRPGASPGEITVLWDEYFHGYRGSLWDYFNKTPVPWAIFQLAVVALFVLLAFGRRSGPIYSPAAVSRLSPLEFVDTLGDLYRRANAGSAAVRVAYKRFRTQLLRRLALAASVSNAELDSAVRERIGWKQPGLMDVLQRADKASRERVTSNAEALKIVQALEHYEVLFGLKTRPNEENR
ncbi:MAG TPA: DUF4350 domain-containing protein [Candidatus Acidoferrales bacterium]|jgi:hypothetical protein|nr:DUF4350 domain-containing protein [Candidatus Acidoferrales bacterium]